MFVLSPLLALIALVVLPALFVVSYRMRQRVFPATWDGQQREGDVAQIVDEGVTGVRVVKAFGQESARTQPARRCRATALRLADAGHPPAGALPAAARGDPVVRPGRDPRASAACSRCTASITIGTFLAFSTYVGQFVAPARQLAGVLTVGQQARAGAERIFQLLDLRAGDRRRAGRHRADRRARRHRLRRRALRLRRRRARAGRFSTAHRAPVSGSRSSGASGSGKSTVAALLSRFHDPIGGRVLLDGHDVRDGHAALAAPRRRRRLRGELPVLRDHPRQHRLRPSGRHRRRDRGRRPRGAGARVRHRAARRLRHRRRRARADPVRRAAAARRAGPRDPRRPARARARRRDQRGRRPHRGGDPRRPARRARRPHHPADRAPRLDPAPGRPGRRARRRPGRRARARTTS